jgi:hypothetical protein
METLLLVGGGLAGARCRSGFRCPSSVVLILESMIRFAGKVINPKMRASPRRIEPDGWHWKSLH